MLFHRNCGLGRNRIRGKDPRNSFVLAQARRANVLLDSPDFFAVIVATNGTMARMNTVHPATFVAFKRWMALSRDQSGIRQLAKQGQIVSQIEHFLLELGKGFLFTGVTAVAERATTSWTCLTSCALPKHWKNGATEPTYRWLTYTSPYQFDRGRFDKPIQPPA